MKKEEKELLEYLKGVWLRVKFGVAVLGGGIVVLGLLCLIIELIKN